VRGGFGKLQGRNGAIGSGKQLYARDQKGGSKKKPNKEGKSILHSGELTARRGEEGKSVVGCIVFCFGSREGEADGG